MSLETMLMMPTGLNATRASTVVLTGEPKYYDVHVGSMPLKAMPGPTRWALSAAYHNSLLSVQHLLVILKPTHLRGPCLVFDFQPKDPENPYIALAALCGSSIPESTCPAGVPWIILGNIIMMEWDDSKPGGIVKERESGKVPAKRHWYVGKENDSCLHEARNFNKEWDTQLRLGKHDCRHYTNALIQQITGQQDILECLKVGTLGKADLMQ